MLSAIVIIIVGIAIAIAAHHYIREPVFRFLGLALGIACVGVGVYWLITSADTHTTIDASSPSMHVVVL